MIPRDASVTPTPAPRKPPKPDPKPESPPPSQAEAPAGPAPAAPASSGTDSGGGPTPPVSSSRALLERGEPAQSNPTASRVLTRRQANLAGELTGASGFRHVAPVRSDVELVHPDPPPEDPDLDHLVDDPSEQEQRSDLKLKPPFRPGGELPELPDFSSPSASFTVTVNLSVPSTLGLAV